MAARKIVCGIDAKWFFDGNASGRVVVRNLVENLDKIDSVEFVYFIKSSFKNNPELSKFRGKKVYVWGGNNMLSNLFVLPVYSLIYRCDCILYQYFPSFLFWKRQYAFVHDIIFITNPDYYTLTERIYLYLLRYLVFFTKGIVTVSEYEVKRMDDWKFGKGIPRHVVYHGVSSDFKPQHLHSPDELNRIKTKYQLPKKYILFVGRLNVRKNILNLLKAFEIVLKSSPDVKLVIVGDKDWKSLDIDFHIKNLGLISNVELKGSVFGKDLPIIFSLATVFCFPSYNESFGLPPLEAMASGVPVVSSNSASLPEICRDAVLYASPDDFQLIAEQLQRFLDDPQLRQTYIRKGLDRAKEFNWTKSSERLLRIFEGS